MGSWSRGSRRKYGHHADASPRARSYITAKMSAASSRSARSSSGTASETEPVRGVRHQAFGISTSTRRRARPRTRTRRCSRVEPGGVTSRLESGVQHEPAVDAPLSTRRASPPPRFVSSAAAVSAGRQWLSRARLQPQQPRAPRALAGVAYACARVAFVTRANPARGAPRARGRLIHASRAERSDLSAHCAGSRKSPRGLPLSASAQSAPRRAVRAATASFSVSRAPSSAACMRSTPATRPVFGVPLAPELPRRRPPRRDRAGVSARRERRCLNRASPLAAILRLRNARARSPWPPRAASRTARPRRATNWGRAPIVSAEEFHRRAAANVHARAGEAHLAFYSSWTDCITTDPAAMVPMDDHMAHGGTACSTPRTCTLDTCTCWTDTSQILQEHARGEHPAPIRPKRR